MQQRPVVIIGAGWSGLQAAALLKNKYGQQVVVVEMRDQVGGTWAEGAAYTSLATHAPASTVQFVGFPYPKDIMANELKRVPAAKVREYVRRFVAHAALGDDIRLRTRVVSVDHVGKRHAKVLVETGGKRETLEASLVINTGFGVVPRQVPAYEGRESFPGPVLTSHEVHDDTLEALKKVEGGVLVLGGSKAAVDIVKLLVELDVPVKWLARKTYWFSLREKLSMDDKTGRRASRFHRWLQILVSGLYPVSPNAAISIQRRFGTVVNPHPETTKGDFHFGVVDRDMMAKAAKADFTQGEVAKLTPTGVVTKSGKTVHCGAIVACFGTDVSPLNPEFLAHGKKIDVINTDHLYQFAVHPSVPTVYHCGPIPLKGFGMLNGYHSVQHVIKYLAEDISEAELERRRLRELGRLKRFFGKRPLVPHLQRSITDTGNILGYIMLAGSIMQRNGFARPLMLSLVHFQYRSNYLSRMDKPVYNHPSAAEVKRAFGPNARALKGYGAAPAASAGALSGRAV